ncbi:MAG: phosphoribosylformylglycinamidine synthase subunit PurQ / glutaminase [Candidatus Sumerlaeota bacterium]|nr:phosphoribosylformylglycinamidine synthase subunit PurQ / glutaminase [Candidatus Sumerlaeota bacterium]
MSARWAVVVFPGSNCDQDFVRALRDVMRVDVRVVWHKDSVPDDVDCIAVPGGFSYGDYLRAGALAAMSPVMESVRRHAERGTLVIGVCNGFQVLCETGLLPGALMKNRALRFRCHDAYLRCELDGGPFAAGQLAKGDTIRLPIAHGYGNYYVPADQLESVRKQIAFTYCDALGEVSDRANPNGSVLNIAGVTNEAGNVLGMMPHPERAVEALLGGTDGLCIIRAMNRWAENTAVR